MDGDDLENIENQPPPAKKKRVRKTRGKSKQVGAKVKKKNQRNYRKNPAKVPLAEAEFEEPIFEDQPGYELEPLPDVPEQSKY